MRHASRGGASLGGPAAAVAREWPTVLVLLVAAAGLALTPWNGVSLQTALLVVAAAPGTGAALRLLLPTRRVGLLAVRGRGLDTLLLAGLAVGIAVLALATPTGTR